LIVSADLASDLQNEIDQKKDQIQQLESQIAKYNEMLKTTKTQGATLKAEITRMQTQISRLQTQITLTQTKISTAALQIETLTNDISTKAVEVEKIKNNLAQIMRVLNEYDQQDPVTLFLQNQNLSDFLSQIQYLNNVQGSAQEKLENIKTLKAQMESQKLAIENQKLELESLKQDLRGQSLVLSNEKSEQQDLLATTKNQEKQYQATLTTLQKQRTQIENEIFAAEQKLLAAINQNSISGGRGAFLWPLKSITITQSYGCIVTSFARNIYPACNEGKGNGGFHNGIDLDGNTGDPIFAVRDGVVSGSGNLGKYAYGKWITIRHDNGLTTLYGHMSAQSVSVGQQVKSGQIIGYVGSTGYSTGAHLHFTVYATNTFTIQQKWYGPVPLGGPINPLLYLQ
jgi:murein DD-endopeptidase MepM/ murein hydrolase activator NlpD